MKISSAGNPVLARRVSRLPELGRTCVSAVDAWLRRPIALSLLKHPIGGFGEMPRNRHGSASMAFDRIESVIEQADVLKAACLHANGDVGSFHNPTPEASSKKLIEWADGNVFQTDRESGQKVDKVGTDEIQAIQVK